MLLTNIKSFSYCSVLKYIFFNNYTNIFYDCSLFLALYKWIHWNLNGEEAQTIQNLNNEHAVFQNNMKKKDNKIKILIKYINACNKTSWYMCHYICNWY